MHESAGLANEECACDTIVDLAGTYGRRGCRRVTGPLNLAQDQQVEPHTLNDAPNGEAPAVRTHALR